MGMRTQPKRQWSELRRVKRDLECYQVAKRNIDDFFKAYPAARDLFTAWMLSRIIPPPDGGRRARRAA
jgi:hypothetical protein